MDEGSHNVIYMSMCFFFLQMTNIGIENNMKGIISGIEVDHRGFHVEGYTLFFLTFMTLGITLWSAPSVLNIFSLPEVMAFASILQILFIASFTTEQEWIIYGATILAGISIGLVWTAEGHYLLLNSNTESVNKHIGIFWAIFCTSSLFGNLYVFFDLNDKTNLDRGRRILMVSVLIIVAATAAVFFKFLPQTNNEVKYQNCTKTERLMEGLKSTWTVFKTKEMLILSVSFCYTGLQQSFNGGIHSLSIGYGFASYFANSARISEQVIFLIRPIFGFGGVLVGVSQFFGGSRLRGYQLGRRIVMGSGIVIHFFAYLLIYLNTSVYEAGKYAGTLVQENAYITLLCSLLLGLGDGCLNIENFSIIAELFPDNGAQSSAMYKFLKAMFVAVGFLLSRYLNFYVQMLIMVLAGSGAFISFTFVDNIVVKSRQTNN